MLGYAELLVAGAYCAVVEGVYVEVDGAYELYGYADAAVAWVCAGAGE